MIYDNTPVAKYRVQDLKQGLVHIVFAYKMWRLKFKYPPNTIIGSAFWVVINGIQ